MTLRLTVDRSAWQRHVDSVRAAVADLVPVVKGNGYGLGRHALAELAASWSNTIAVGTLHEAAALDHLGDVTVVSLTPAIEIPADLPAATVPTVGSPSHVRALRRAGWSGRVAVKLASPMRRYGVEPGGLAELLDEIRAAGCEPSMFVFHPPLAVEGRSDADTLDDLARWVDHLDPGLPVSVSHLTPDGFAALVDRWPDRHWSLRSGTALWHGDKSFLRLEADVIDIHRVAVGERVGYRGTPSDRDGRLVMIGAGSAHGVTPLPDGRSPFHFARHRLALLEPPHMHTSMAVVGDDQPQPEIGDRVDVQRPLITVHPDVVVWR